MQALDEIAKELPTRSQPARDLNPEADANDSETNADLEVIDLTEPTGKEMKANLKRKPNVPGISSSQLPCVASSQLPGRRHAAKGRQPSRLAKESRPDSEPLQAPPQPLKISVSCNLSLSPKQSSTHTT